jgi:hypothetical protein
MQIRTSSLSGPKIKSHQIPPIFPLAMHLTPNGEGLNFLARISAFKAANRFASAHFGTEFVWARSVPPVDSVFHSSISG